MCVSKEKASTRRQCRRERASTVDNEHKRTRARARCNGETHKEGRTSKRVIVSALICIDVHNRQELTMSNQRLGGGKRRARACACATNIDIKNSKLHPDGFASHPKT